jgi:hypothetical protein
MAWAGIAGALGLAAATDASHRAPDLALSVLGSYTTGFFDQGASEIVAYDPRGHRLYVVNAAGSSVDVLDISNPASPGLDFVINVLPYGAQANSVAIHKGLVAIAVQAEPKTDDGKVLFVRTDGTFVGVRTVGALPDMLTFAPDGSAVLVANEGEPSTDYLIDPPGTVSIIDIDERHGRLFPDGVKTLDFSWFNGRPLSPSIRIFGPGASVAQDLEPEYIAVSPDSKTAWATLQENNALAEIDLRRKKITALRGLGFKDHSQPGLGLDPSDRDGGVHIGNWPVLGMFQPDTIIAFEDEDGGRHDDDDDDDDGDRRRHDRNGGRRDRDRTYLLTVNEGDARDWEAFQEEARVSSLALDPEAFPNAATLKQNANLGRLNVTNATGDDDDDGDFDRLLVFGGRSFSIRSTRGRLLFDSGQQIEEITAAAFPEFFNASNTDNTLDSRSDNKGPEPEGAVVARLFDHNYAFIGLERIGGVVVYALDKPSRPRWVTYVNNRDFTGDPEAGTAGDLGPEGLVVIPKRHSPIRHPLLVVANEISGSTTIYKIEKVR